MASDHELCSILGDVPVMTYFDFQSRGRGEVVRLFFVDAGIPFKDVRWSFDGYNSLTEEQKDRFKYVLLTLCTSSLAPLLMSESCFWKPYGTSAIRARKRNEIYSNLFNVEEVC